MKKKTILSLLITLISLALPSLALAEADTIKMEEILPADKSLVMEINTEDPIQAEIGKNIITSALSKFIFMVETKSAEKVYNNILEDITTANKIQFSYTDNTLTIITKVKPYLEDELKNIILDEKTSYKNKLNEIDYTCNTQESTLCYSYLNPYSVITVGEVNNPEEEVKKIINLYTGIESDTEKNILTNKSYLETTKTIGAPYFLSAFIDFDNLSDNEMMFPQMGFSLKKETGAYTFNLLNIGNQAEMAAKDINLEKTLAVPYLYQKFPNKSPFFYMEMGNMSEIYQKADDSFKKYAEIFKFLNYINIDFEKDLLEMLKNQSAIGISKGEARLLPNITLMVDIINDKEKAEGFVKKFEEGIFSLLSTLPNDSYLPSESYIFKNKLTEITFLPEKAFKNKLKPEEINLLKDEKIVLTYGITDDNILLISTDPNISADYGQKTGLKDELQTSIPGDQMIQKLSSLAVFNLEELSSYLKSNIDLFYSKLPEEQKTMETEINNLKNNIDKSFSFATKIAFISSALNGTNFNQQIKLFQKEENMNPLDIFQNSILKNIRTYYLDKASAKEVIEKFTDIQASDWFFPYVIKLNRFNALEHFEAPFTAVKPITRIEFLAALMKAFNINIDEKVISEASEANAPIFSDVSVTDWFYPTLKAAVEKNIITGYEDGTFKPNQEINRAEALKIVAQLSSKLSRFEIREDISVPFKDVEKGMWYYDVIAKSYLNKIVNGSSTDAFEPGRSIFRGEAMKIIYNIYTFELGEEEPNPLEDYYPNLEMLY